MTFSLFDKGKAMMAAGGRKGKRMAEQSYVNMKVGRCAEENDDFILTYDELDRYDFPTEDAVPEGYYLAKIVGAVKSENKYGDPCFEICHKLISRKDYDAWAEGYLERFSYSYIRQKYKIGSSSARKFMNDMIKGGMPQSFKLSELVGYTEYIKLEYDRRNGFGNIVERKRQHLSDDYFTDDEMN